MCFLPVIPGLLLTLFIHRIEKINHSFCILPTFIQKRHVIRITDISRATSRISYQFTPVAWASSKLACDQPFVLYPFFFFSFFRIFRFFLVPLPGTDEKGSHWLSVRSIHQAVFESEPL